MENVNKNNIYRQEDKDILRIILVALVVIGHGTYYNITTKFGGINYGTMMSDASISDTMFHKITSILTNFIYTFHMPAFIALSGSLFSLKKNINTRGTIIKKTKRLLVPFIAVWIFWNLPVKYFSGYYHGVSIKGMLLQLIFPSCVYLWYLECLFFVFVIASFVCKLETKKQIVIVSFCWCIGVILYKGLDQYHVLGDPLYYLLWFYLGYRLENMIEWLKKHNIWKDSSILCLFGLVCLSFIVDKIVKIHRIEHQLTDKLGRTPSKRELSQELNIDEELLTKILHTVEDTVSLDMPVGSGNEVTTFGEFISDSSNELEDDISKLSDNIIINEAMEVLTPKEREVIALRYGLNGDDALTFQAIGDKLGVTRERIRQIENRALKKMKDSSLALKRK